jgi:phosphotransferase system enzyme I (PtsI)
MDNTDNSQNEIRLLGIGGSPGITIGKAYIVDKKGAELISKYPIEKKDIKSEVKRFKAAVKTAKDQLLDIIDSTPDKLKQHAYVFETHLQLLKDKMLYGMTIDTIEKEQVNAEWAFKKTVSQIKTMFQDIDDPYLRERSSDIVQVGDRILSNLIGEMQVNIAEITSRVILVAKDFSPAETSQINLKRVKGFVTDRGGKTSHTSIIARSMEIPAVLGLEKATRVINNDDLIIVDGLSGIVIINPTEATLIEFAERDQNYEAHRSVFIRNSHLAAITQDKVELKVLGSIEQHEEAKTAIDHGADGIGLYRTEFQYMRRPTFPTERELYSYYRETVETMAPRPVTFRTLDINGDKLINPGNENNREENPALGLRAIRYCLKNQGVFKTQLRAILRAAAHGKTRILFPMISNHEEVLRTKRLLDEAAWELENEGKAYGRDLQVGIMIEVPSAVLMAETLAKEVDFFSIGTNDLIQYTLAIDRNNKEVSYLYQPMHPSILRMLKHVTDIGKKTGTTICICGEMAADPIHVPVLLGLGISEFSLLPTSIPPVKSLLRTLNATETVGLVDELLTYHSAKDIVSKLHARYGGLLDDDAYLEADPAT